MNRFNLFALTLTLVAGCGYTEDKFADDYADAYCERMVSCEAEIVAAYEGMGLDAETSQSTYDDAYTLSCETEVDDDGEGEGDDNCEFNADKADECVTGVEELSCDFWSTGTGFPAACGEVCG